MSTIDRKDLARRIRGCWLGKAIGGTLGGPPEGQPGPLNLSFYDPVPDTMVPNDDLDLQVVWACLLAESKDPVVDGELFRRGWLNHVGFRMDEYGVCVRNLQAGVSPTQCGSYDNWFTDGMGAAIRSEIWACVAPGNPELAAEFARVDASLDHTGDGLDAEVFLAALESAAFVDQDINRIIDIGLAHIPADGRLARAIRDTRRWCRELPNWRDVRRRILDHYGHENFTDCVQNLAITVLGLMVGNGDFDRTICTAVNCGQDTDCTGATAGSIMGLLFPEKISNEWKKPIGNTLALSPPINLPSAPKTIDAFSDMILDLSGRVRLGKIPKPAPILDPPLATTLKILDMPWIAGWSGSIRNWWYSRPRTLETRGTVVHLPITAWGSEALMVSWNFELSHETKVQVMVNTHLPIRAWVDEKFAFGSDGGAMAPSPHRHALGNHCFLTLAQGGHSLRFLLKKPSAGYGDFVFAVAEADTGNSGWILEAHAPAAVRKKAPVKRAATR